MRTKVNYRKIWEDHNKQHIPFGYHIHHKDGNNNNNDPINLLCLSAWDHFNLHKAQGDKREAALIYGRWIAGKNVEYPTYMYALKNKDSKALWTMSKQDFIYIPRYAKDLGVKPIDVEFWEDFDHLIDDSEIYSEPDVELVEIIFNRLTSSEKLLLEYSFGINRDKMSEKEMCKIYKASRGSIRQKKHRLIKRIKNEMV